MNRTRANRRWIACWLLCGLLGVACVAARAPAAEDSPKGGRSNWRAADAEEKSVEPAPKPQPSEAKTKPKPKDAAAERSDDHMLVVYALKHVDLQTAISLLRTAAPEAVATIDSSGNRMIVMGSPSTHQRVAEVLKALDAAPGDQEDRLVIAYQLKHSDPQMTATIVAEAVPFARVTPEPGARRLIVFATRSDHERIEELLKALDVAPKTDVDQTPRLEVYRLTHLDAQTVIPILQMAVTPVGSVAPRMEADEKNNSIVVFGPPSVHLEVRQILERLDVPPDPEGQHQIKVFRLHNAEAEAVVETVSELLEADDVRLSLDPRTNSIVAAGEQGALEVIEALILRLEEAKDQEIRETLSTTFQVRLVWLVGGLEGEKGALPAEDLKPVLEELAKLGVSEVRQVGQVVVNTSSDGVFQVTCTPLLEQFAATMRIHGALELQQGIPLMDIDINGRQLVAVPVDDEDVAGAPEGYAKPRRVDHSELASLSTRIAAPDGQYVVLGVTPAGKLTSVFIVQVTPQ